MDDEGSFEFNEKDRAISMIHMRRFPVDTVAKGFKLSILESAMPGEPVIQLLSDHESWGTNAR